MDLRQCQYYDSSDINPFLLLPTPPAHFPNLSIDIYILRPMTCVPRHRQRLPMAVSPTMRFYEMLYFDLFQGSMTGIKSYLDSHLCIARTQAHVEQTVLGVYVSNEQKYEAGRRNGRRVEMRVEERTVSDRNSIVTMKVGSLYAV